MSYLIEDKGFKFMMMNVRSLYSSVDEIALKFGNIDVIALCETWLNESVTDEMLNIPGYKILRLDRTAGNIRNARDRPKRGGGLLFYISERYSNNVSIISTCSKVTYNLEQLWICIQKPNVRKMTIGVVYRPPHAKVEEAVSELTNSLTYIKDLSDAEVIVSGDLNINYNQRHSKGFELLKNMERNFNFAQIIKSATRIVDGAKSLLDLIFTDMEFIFRSGVLEVGISDHLPVFLVRKKEREKMEYSYINGRTYSTYNKDAFQNDILQHNVWDVYWNTNSRDVELLWSYIKIIITEIADIHCPVRRMKISNDSPHWMCKEIIECIHQKDDLHRKAMYTNKSIDWCAYRAMRKEVKVTIMKAKEEYIKDQLENSKNNPRKFWRNINEISGLGKSKNKSKIGKIIDENGEIYEDQRASDFLNIFYTEAGPRLAEKFQDSWNADKSGIKVDSKFSFSRISEYQVLRIVKDIKIFKSCAVDNLSARLLKDAFVVMIPELTYLFNLCIELGDLPQSWCHGTISPIPKVKTNSNKPKDWRPITQIPLPGKMLEKIVHDQIYTYFNNNNLLSPQQYGFRPGMSTSQAIFDVLRVLYTNWNDRVFTGCIFVDYSRAFETIDHNILLAKLKMYGLDDISLNFFRNYITNRTQSTVVNGFVSADREVVYGTAQGSVLGPLIYIIYVNDVLKVLSATNKIIMYADDMLIISRDASEARMIDDLQNNLNKVVRWCNHNKLTINREKTKYMFISNRTSMITSSIFIHDQKLSRVSQYEYLGVIIDKDLKLTPYVESMFKKANSKLGILSKIRRFITEETAVRIYKVMIRPYLEYVDFAIDSSSKEKVDRIDRLQCKALRRIEHCNIPEEREPYVVLERKYKIEKLCIRRKRSLLRMMYMSSKDNDNIKEVEHDINLRSRSKVKLKDDFSSLTKLHNSPYFRGLKLWNALPHEVQKAENNQVFKSLVKGLIK